MNILFPVTGLVQIFILGVCYILALRFYHCWQKENNRIAKFFMYFLTLRGVAALLLAIPAILLIKNSQLWNITIPLFITFSMSSIVVLAYIFSEIRFPQYTNLFLGITIFVVAVTSFFIFYYPPLYYFVGGVVGWHFDLNNTLLMVSIIISSLLLYLGVCLPLGVIFLFQFKKAVDKKVRIRALGLGLSMIWIILPIILDFFIMSILPAANPIYTDINCFFGNLLLLITILLTWSPPPKYVTKIE